ncbi:MAG: AfsA-related hotdog domain-containing protein [Pseudonocardiaceae bacterium]
MPHDTVIVVGARFDAFLTNHGTISTAGLMRRLRTLGGSRTLSVTIGQGLSADQLGKVRRLIESNPRAVAVGGIPEFAEKHLTHKRNPKNTMVGTPVRLAADRFVTDLLIDEHTEVLEDHLTGQHIPAIALMEAARQTWTAVTEMYLLKDTATTQRFVVSSMRSAFHKYVFPLPACVEYRLVGHQASTTGQVFKCLICVYQEDVLAAEVEAEYLVIPEAFSEKYESMVARQTLVGHLTRVEHSAEKAG